MLDENSRNCVIECGLGSLTTGVQEHLRVYATTHPVVYLIRDMTNIQQLLKLDDRSARLLANGDPTHRRCSNFEYFNLEEHYPDVGSDDRATDRWSPAYSFKLKQSKEDFTFFVRQITGANTLRSNQTAPLSLLETPVEQRLFTHALAIPLSRLENGPMDFEKYESAGDAIEVVIDEWSKSHPVILTKQISLLRRHVGVPIIITVDQTAELEEEQITDFDGETYMAILEHALRLGVEFVSVNLNLEDDQIRRLNESKGFTKIIGHYVEQGSNTRSWEDPSWERQYDRAAALSCDVVRLLKASTDRSDNLGAQVFADHIRRHKGTKNQLIAYNTGPIGRTSLLYNPVLSRVSHTSLEPDDNSNLERRLTSRAAIRALFQSYVLDPLHFWIFGANVLYSLSPAMYNAAFNACGLDHKYTARNVSTFKEIAQISQDSHFGGASIVRPYKVAVIHELASKSKHAEAIGAVNTIVPLRGLGDGTVAPLEYQASQRNRAGKVAAWYGDNTDWIGILAVLTRSLSPRNVVRPTRTTGIVIGAGGMARAAIYAMIQLGCRKIYIYNRTIPNAEKIANHFNAWASSPENEKVVTVLRSIQEPWPETEEAPTMIVSCVPAHSIDGQPEANFEMPKQWLGSSSGGVVIDLAYKPLNTPLLKQMRCFRHDTGQPWVVHDGLETLPEQAIAQFELFTGRKAPRSLMRFECLRNYRGEEGQYDENAIRTRLSSTLT
ncbi:putative repressor protein [Phaeomoniella chlamydospora]|uniref:Putative repressor protein n=1 Tax=Phaeomoniella chlamydospora TaxID=158046 RepID=A0A0G2GFL0_PHACM|nr:putative repressor protein [Phaeomoniella chlamydospora]